MSQSGNRTQYISLTTQPTARYGTQWGAGKFTLDTIVCGPNLSAYVDIKLYEFNMLAARFFFKFPPEERALVGTFWFIRKTRLRGHKHFNLIQVSIHVLLVTYNFSLTFKSILKLIIPFTVWRHLYSNVHTYIHMLFVR